MSHLFNRYSHTDKLVFSATIASDGTFEILEDKNSLFSASFMRLINGTYTATYIDEDEYKVVFAFRYKCPLKNLGKFIERRNILAELRTELTPIGTQNEK